MRKTTTKTIEDLIAAQKKEIARLDARYAEQAVKIQEEYPEDTYGTKWMDLMCELDPEYDRNKETAETLLQALIAVEYDIKDKAIVRDSRIHRDELVRIPCRCKDCKNYDGGFCWKHCRGVVPEGFCNFAERGGEDDRD